MPKKDSTGETPRRSRKNPASSARRKKRVAKKGYKLLRTGNGDRIIPPRHKRNKRYVIVEKIVEKIVEVPVLDLTNPTAVPTFIQEKPILQYERSRNPEKTKNTKWRQV
jgi:hypothetical protein